MLPAVDRYERDPKFRDELLTKFFSAEFRTTFDKTTSKQSTQPQSVQPSPSTGTGADAYVAQGKKYREAKDYAKAIEAYKKAAALQPANADAHFGLAVSYYYQEKWQLSISAWKQYLTLVQPFPGALILLGDAQLQLKQYDEALKTFRSIISLKPDAEKLAEAHFWIGRTYNDMQQYENAVSAFKEALRINPNAAHMSRELGAAYYLLKQYPDALAAFQRAVRLKPDDALAQYDLGKTYVAMGKKDEALQVYRTLQTIDKAKAQNLLVEINKSK